MILVMMNAEMTPVTAATRRSFESEVCSRCGGGGSYSWNRINGSVCFKCGGAGKVLTKRGAAASRFLTALRSKPVEAVVVGDKVWDKGSMFSPAAWLTVEKVETRTMKGASNGVPCEWTNIVLSGTTKTGRAASVAEFPGSPVRVAMTAEERASTYAAALAYEDTLTKTGTVRKARAGKES